jgi:hypothetical protein
VQKISGAAWAPLKQQFFDASEALLRVADGARSELTTIYVKYSIEIVDKWIPYAVIWIKKSSELVIGLALPDDFEATGVVAPPSGLKYPFLTKYVVIRAGEQLPSQFGEWARLAHSNVVSKK